MSDKVQDDFLKLLEGSFRFLYQHLAFTTCFLLMYFSLSLFGQGILLYLYKTPSTILQTFFGAVYYILYTGINVALYLTVDQIYNKKVDLDKLYNTFTIKYVGYILNYLVVGVIVAIPIGLSYGLIKPQTSLTNYFILGVGLTLSFILAVKLCLSPVHSIFSTPNNPEQYYPKLVLQEICTKTKGVHKFKNISTFGVLSIVVPISINYATQRIDYFYLAIFVNTLLYVYIGVLTYYLYRHTVQGDILVSTKIAKFNKHKTIFEPENINKQYNELPLSSTNKDE